MQGVGIKHIEYWVTDVASALGVYRSFFELLGWEYTGKAGFRGGGVEIYFKRAPEGVGKKDSFGPRHICFRAASREIVDRVGALLLERRVRIIRGPQVMVGEEYSRDYYTVDFIGPEGFIFEVAHTPHSML